jgi:hypothetical protein
MTKKTTIPAAAPQMAPPASPVGGASARRRGRRAAMLAAIAAIAAAIPLTAAGPAGAIQGLDVYWSATTQPSHQPTQSAFANCPSDKHVVGGGGGVIGRSDVRLTRLLPAEGSPDHFQVIAQAPNVSPSGGTWTVYARAICANRAALDARDYDIVEDPDELTNTSTQFQKTHAQCPAGTVAYSAGADIQSPNGRVGLQLNRTSGPQDISRATAREVSGYTGSWEVRSYAVCANASGLGMHVEDTIKPGPYAEHPCSGNYQLHGAGGGGGLDDGGPSWLTDLAPDLIHKTVQVQMTGPLSPSIGGMVAHANCAL